MNNIDSLFKHKSLLGFQKRIPFKNHMFTFANFSEILDGNQLATIIRFINSTKKRFNNMIVPLCFDLGNIKVYDKLTITILECILYVLCKQNYPICVYYMMPNEIHSECIKYSPMQWLSGNNISKAEKYCSSFEKDFSLGHYRRIIPLSASEDGTLSAVMGDLQFFFRHVDIHDEYCKKLAEVCVELIGNACEHGQSDCLIDIDVTDIYRKKLPDGGMSVDQFRGVNVTLVSFSQNLLGSGLKEKVFQEKANNRYKYVQNAYHNHKVFFSKEYTEEDFFRIVAFQDKITCRLDEYSAGGTGLTKLLQSLEELSEDDVCYVLSGEKGLLFKNNVLDYDQNGWIGFNAQKDFANAIPDPGIILKTPLFVPGIAYNLNYIVKLEGSENGNKN